VVGEGRHRWAGRVRYTPLRSYHRCLKARANPLSCSGFQVCNTSHALLIDQMGYLPSGPQKPLRRSQRHALPGRCGCRLDRNAGAAHTMTTTRPRRTGRSANS
jgi:hypothetical protein